MRSYQELNRPKARAQYLVVECWNGEQRAHLESNAIAFLTPAPTAGEIRGARANGLLSPALSSKGGEGVACCSRSLQIAHDKRSKFLMQMRRNARFKPGGVATVTALDDLRHFVQTRDDTWPVVRHG